MTFSYRTVLLNKLAPLALGAGMLASQTAMAGGNTNVSVSVGQPGFYGRIDIGDQPPPTLIYPQPVLIQQTPVAVHQRPIYMRVPPGHYKHWERYCGQYRACGQPVYFVPESYGRERGERRDRDRDGRDEHRHEEHGHGHGKGHGHGRGHGHDRD